MTEKQETNEKSGAGSAMDQVSADIAGVPTATGTEEQIIDEVKKPTWNAAQVEMALRRAYEDNAEVDVLKILKDNSFLFYDLYLRKLGVQPIFREINFGTERKCDFAWLNDNSSGPEWVLVEVEKPKMDLFKANGDPTAPFTMPSNR